MTTPYLQLVDLALQLRIDGNHLLERLLDEAHATVQLRVVLLLHKGVEDPPQGAGNHAMAVMHVVVVAVGG